MKAVHVLWGQERYGAAGIRSTEIDEVIEVFPWASRPPWIGKQTETHHCRSEQKRVLEYVKYYVAAVVKSISALFRMLLHHKVVPRPIPAAFAMV